MTDYRILYLVVWLTILALYYVLGPAAYPPLTPGVIWIVLGLPTLGYALASVIPQPRIRQVCVEDTKYETRLKYLFGLWGLLSVVSLAGGGPLPILAIGSNSYAEFGVSGIGGLQNSVALAIVPLFYLYYRSSGKKKYLAGVIIVVLWQILTFRRGMFVTFIFQILVVRQIRYGSIGKVTAAVIALSIILIFGIIGDIRGLPNPYITLFSGWKRDLFEALPSGFTWVYVYATSGVSNLANNYLHIPDCGNYFYPFGTVLPSFLRPVSECEYRLYNVSLNVGSVYSGLMSAGYLAICIYLTCLCYLYRRVFLKVQKFQTDGAISAYSIPLIGILFSPFSDLIFLPTYVFGIILLSYFPAPISAIKRPKDPACHCLATQ